ncbi:hypothetical protein MLD38_021147 [Melastoma candidum]|uniref:Uncharacterized protein n=1 Tax=Melastoma candidum TaxID=119954 RepID=A0ACB9QFF6_9MYRT|nr:hypothetical protein MLD38_021147 [Melastoma candidum]
MGFGSPSPVTMIVTSTPAPDLALTNLAYCSPSDHFSFAVPGTKLFLANVADAFILSLSYPFLLLVLSEGLMIAVRKPPALERYVEHDSTMFSSAIC